MTNATSILLVDDHALLRDTLRGRLQAEVGLDVVGVAGSGGEAVAEAGRLKPDVVLMDIDMPGLVCFDAVRTIKTISPASRFIYLSAFHQDRYVEHALAAHAMGYVTKDEPPEVVIRAIRRVMSGVACFSPKVQARLVFDEGGPRLATPTQSRLSLLTRREMEVLCYLGRGLAKKEIAQTMHIAVNTVNIHASSVMRKLSIHDRVALARFAIREGIVEA